MGYTAPIVHLCGNPEPVNLLIHLRKVVFLLLSSLSNPEDTSKPFKRDANGDKTITTQISS